MNKIIKDAEEINLKIKEFIFDKTNNSVVKKSLSVEKAIALIEQKLKKSLSILPEMYREDILFLEKNGLTIIVESDLPLTTKAEKELSNLYNEKGYFFSYNANNDKEKYYLCVGTKK